MDERKQGGRKKSYRSERGVRIIVLASDQREGLGLVFWLQIRERERDGV